MTSLDLSGISGAHVVVTGGAGLIGTFASAQLLETDAASVAVVDRRPWDGNPAADALELPARLPHGNVDLRVREAIDPILDRADVVLHLAGETQGNAASLECEPGNEGYGFAKLILERGVTEFTRQGSGITSAVVRLANAYGESYRWKGLEQSHLVPSLVYKAATNPVLSVWGDGTQQRDLMHAGDIARAILAAGAKAVATGEAIDPMNLAGGDPTSVRDLAAALVGMLGCEEVEYDSKKPSGNKAKTLDLGRFHGALPDFVPEIDLRAGLERMIDIWLPRIRAAEG